MDRRTFLRAAGLGGAGALAGCTSFLDGNPDVVLGEPDRQYDSGDVPYPAWGEQMPDVTVPAPLEGGTVALREVGQPSLTTFFFTHCTTVCPALVGALRNVQAHATENGYVDDVRFLPVTFDPERDTADRLREYADRMNVAPDGGWTFLRPPGVDAAKDLINGEFAVGFQRVPASEVEHEAHEGYDFQHLSLVLLVNADGYVERAYTGTSPDDSRFVADLRTVRNA